jgi:8-oxo-dGTP diphosphatase
MALPGGFVDYNEDPSESCIRELLEETNIPGQILALVGVFGKALRDPRHHTVTTAYLVKPDSLNAEGLVDFKAGDDAKEAGFYDLD